MPDPTREQLIDQATEKLKQAAEKAKQSREAFDAGDEALGQQRLSESQDLVQQAIQLLAAAAQMGN